MFKTICLLLTTFQCITTIEFALKPLLGTELGECLRCLCSTSAGCDDLKKCAKKSVKEDYWRLAWRQTLGEDSDNFDSDTISGLYRKCVKDDNCILNTMALYTDIYGVLLDTNCDGLFECKDRLPLHLNGALTSNFSVSSFWIRRFENCAERRKIFVSNDWIPCDEDIITGKSWSGLSKF